MQEKILVYETIFKVRNHASNDRRLYWLIMTSKPENSCTIPVQIPIVSKHPHVSISHSSIQAEMNQMRRRGLAKIFHQHFISASEAIEQEKLSVNKALTEIIQKKEEIVISSRQLKFEGSCDVINEVTMTRLDKLHLDIQRQKVDVQRKEHETMELLRKYVYLYDNETSSFSIYPECKSDRFFNSRELSETMPIVCECTTHNGNLSETKGKTLKELFKPQIQIPTRDTCTEVLLKCNDDETFSSSSQSHSGAMLQNHALNINNSKMSMPQREDIYILPDIKSFSRKLYTKCNSCNKHKRQQLQFLNCSMNNEYYSSISTRKYVSDYITEETSDLEPMDGKNIKENIFSNHNHCNLPHHRISEDDQESVLSGLTSIDMDITTGVEWKLSELLRVEMESIKYMPSSNEYYTEKNNTSNSDMDITRDISEEYLERQISANRALSFSNRIHAKREEHVVSMEENVLNKLGKYSPSVLENSLSLNSLDLHNVSIKRGDDSSFSSVKDVYNKSNEKNYEWTVHWSIEQGMEYYHNVITSETCWARPRGVEVDISTLPESKQTSLKNNDNDMVIVKDFTDLTKSDNPTSSMDDNTSMVSLFHPDFTLFSPDGTSVFPGRSLNVKQYKRIRGRHHKIVLGQIFAMIVVLGALGKFSYNKKNVLSLLVNIDIYSNQWIRKNFETSMKIKENKPKIFEMSIVSKDYHKSTVKRQVFEDEENHEKKTFESSKISDVLHKKSKIDIPLKVEHIVKKGIVDIVNVDKGGGNNDSVIVLGRDIKLQDIYYRDMLNTEINKNQVIVRNENVLNPKFCTMPLSYLISKRCNQFVAKGLQLGNIWKPDLRKGSKEIENTQEILDTFQSKKSCIMPFSYVIKKKCREPSKKRLEIYLKIFFHSMMR